MARGLGAGRSVSRLRQRLLTLRYCAVFYFVAIVTGVTFYRVQRVGNGGHQIGDGGLV